MDWKTFLTTFSLIFLAELGDKTQIASINMVCSTKKYWEVLLGASLALVLVTALGVLFGEALLKIVPEQILHKISAVVFIIIGIIMLIKG